MTEYFLQQVWLSLQVLYSNVAFSFDNKVFRLDNHDSVSTEIRVTWGFQFYFYTFLHIYISWQPYPTGAGLAETIDLQFLFKHTNFAWSTFINLFIHAHAVGTLDAISLEYVTNLVFLRTYRSILSSSAIHKPSIHDYSQINKNKSRRYKNAVTNVTSVQNSITSITANWCLQSQ